jgi:hypothetical protein
MDGGDRQDTGMDIIMDIVGVIMQVQGQVIMQAEEMQHITMFIETDRMVFPGQEGQAEIPDQADHLPRLIPRLKTEQHNRLTGQTMFIPTGMETFTERMATTGKPVKEVNGRMLQSHKEQGLKQGRQHRQHAIEVNQETRCKQEM